MTKERLSAETNIGDIITAHPFTPKNPERGYWSLCATCNLALAAHARSDVDNVPAAPRAKPEKSGEVVTEGPVSPSVTKDTLAANNGKPPS